MQANMGATHRSDWPCKFIIRACALPEYSLLLTATQNAPVAHIRIRPLVSVVAKVWPSGENVSAVTGLR